MHYKLLFIHHPVALVDNERLASSFWWKRQQKACSMKKETEGLLYFTCVNQTFTEMLHQFPTAGCSMPKLIHSSTTNFTDNLNKWEYARNQSENDILCLLNFFSSPFFATHHAAPLCSTHHHLTSRQSHWHTEKQGHDNLWLLCQWYRHNDAVL